MLIFGIPEQNINLLTYGGMLQVKTPVDLEVDREKQIIKAILYFSIFNYPLTRKEVMALSGDAYSSDMLDDLVSRNLIGCCADHYGFGIQPDWVDDRLTDEKRFQKAQHKLKRSTRIISRFPFVDGIALSGASSKGLMKKDGDLDFFIITKPNRLWLCRTMLVLNKKLFRLNSKRFFCVNYFISNDNLEIPDKNRFTASEIVYLAPLYNTELFDTFLESNQWINLFYSNADARKDFPIVHRESKLKVSLEKMLSGRMGSRLDKWAHGLTHKRWKRKFSHYEQEDFELTMRSENNVSKHHPSNFQKRVLSRYDKKVEEFEKQHGIFL